MKYYAKHQAEESFLTREILWGIALAALCAAVLWPALHWLTPQPVKRPQPTPMKPASASAPAFSSHAPSSAASSVPPSALESQAVDLQDWELVLVNYDHKLPDTYRPELVDAFGLQMDERIVEPYQKMQDAAVKDGISIWISSAYRSDARQEVLFEQEVSSAAQLTSAADSAEAFAAKSVARPGYSEHSTGLALDFNGVSDDFDQTPAFRWLMDHAAEYGFILRYPKDKQEITQIKYEPWHFRYVGVQNAENMKKENLCLEEYLNSQEKTGSVN